MWWERILNIRDFLDKDKYFDDDFAKFTECIHAVEKYFIYIFTTFDLSKQYYDHTPQSRFKSTDRDIRKSIMKCICSDQPYCDFLEKLTQQSMKDIVDRLFVLYRNGKLSEDARKTAEYISFQKHKLCPLLLLEEQSIMEELCENFCEVHGLTKFIITMLGCLHAAWHNIHEIFGDTINIYIDYVMAKDFPMDYKLLIKEDILIRSIDEKDSKGDVVTIPIFSSSFSRNMSRFQEIISEKIHEDIQGVNLLSKF